MPNQHPLNPDAEVNKDQTIFAYEAAERDYPQYGSIMLKLHHSNFQSSLWQVSKRTAESLRDHLNDLVAVAQPVVTGEQVNLAGWTCDGIHEPGSYATCEDCRGACDDLANFYNQMRSTPNASGPWTYRPVVNDA